MPCNEGGGAREGGDRAVSVRPTRARGPDDNSVFEVMWFTIILAIAIAGAVRLVVSNFGDQGDERPYESGL